LTYLYKGHLSYGYETHVIQQFIGSNNVSFNSYHIFHVHERKAEVELKKSATKGATGTLFELNYM